MGFWADIRAAKKLIKSRRRKRRAKRRALATVRELIVVDRPVKLELGSARKGKDSWTTVDLVAGCDICWDLTKGLPFPEGTIDAIYSSHFLEHIKYRDLIVLLEQCRQVLRPDGLFSACVPDAGVFLSAYFSGVDVSLDYEPARCGSKRIDCVNYIAYMDGHHKHLFDRENLCQILEDTGYRNVRLREFDEAMDMPERRHESIYVEARK